LDFPDLKGYDGIPEFDNIAFDGMLNNNSESSMIQLSSLKDSFIFPPFFYIRYKIRSLAGTQT
jgi:hypothetical protein